MTSRFLSKSRYMNGLQCPKLLWMACNAPDKIPEPDASTQHVFDQGHLVGELAKYLYPGGIDVPHDDFKENVGRTRELLAERKTLFEAGFMSGGLFSRLDILKPAGRDAWDIVEVKSSTSVKEENLHDVSFQRHCCRQHGLKIDNCYLAYVNNQYVRKGELDPAGLFTIQDITTEVDAAANGLEDRIHSMFATIASAECPDVPVGGQCSSPYDCPVSTCWEELPANNIFTLYRGGNKCCELFHQGILYIKDVPGAIKLSRSQQIQKWCDINGIPHIEPKPIRNFLASLQYPLHYLDFETINPTVPLFNGTRPYQKIPFQFSLHLAEDHGTVKHYSYLAEGTGDPRPQFLARLKKAFGKSGTVVTYNQAFEEGVLNDLARTFPEYADWIKGVCGRMVDLLEPFRKFHYYHPDQSGSASIKHVMPALTGKGYEGMEIADGAAASREFLNVTYGGASEEERQQVRANLERYCGLDTEGMMWIVERLRQVSNS
ncbi:MAG: DUF2779 domain-containing protein [Chloroflexi bacterium]|nr:DUF2779 domain-containing protein [Chloroflexota bacterium]